MQGHDGDVAGPLGGHHSIREIDRAAFGEVTDVGDARTIGGGGPMGRNATGFQAGCHRDHAASTGQIRHRWTLRLPRVESRAHKSDSGFA